MNVSKAIFRMRMVQRHTAQASFPRTTSSPSVSQAHDDFADLVYGHDTGVRTVTFNRPTKVNALNLPMVHHLTKRLQKIEANETVNAVVFNGSGDRAFCAGGDVRALRDCAIDPATRHLAIDFFRHEYRLNYMLATTEKPIISFLNGVTMGSGVGLSMHGKFVVATEKTLFAMPETELGLIADIGCSYMFPRLGHKISLRSVVRMTDGLSKSKAMAGQGVGTYLALTGDRLQGKELIAFGLATHYLPTEEYETLIHHLTGLEFASSVPQEERDEVIHEAIEELETDEAFQEIDPEFYATVESVFGAHNEDDTVEGIFERLQKLNSEWSVKTLEKLNRMSPLALKITLEQMRQGAKKNFAECLQMEFRIMTRLMETPDFFEGVRAVLIDKDRKPKWTPKTLGEVTPEMVSKYFAPLPEDQELVLYSSVNK